MCYELPDWMVEKIYDRWKQESGLFLTPLNEYEIFHLIRAVWKQCCEDCKEGMDGN